MVRLGSVDCGWVRLDSERFGWTDWLSVICVEVESRAPDVLEPGFSPPGRGGRPDSKRTSVPSPIFTGFFDFPSVPKLMSWYAWQSRFRAVFAGVGTLVRLRKMRGLDSPVFSIARGFRDKTGKCVGEISQVVAFALSLADANRPGVDSVGAETAAEPGFVDGTAVVGLVPGALGAGAEFSD